MQRFKITKSLFIFASFALAVGCGNKVEKPATEPEPEVQIESEPITEAPVDEPIDEDALPIPADFQDEVDESITEDNYKEELAAIEKELESES